MKWKAAVTFESETQPPKTWRGEIESRGTASALGRALTQAKKAYPGAKWLSVSMFVEKLKHASRAD